MTIADLFCGLRKHCYFSKKGKFSLMNRCLNNSIGLGTALLFIFSLGAIAAPANFSGMVVDPKDAAMVGADIILINAQGTDLQHTTTDAHGKFELPNIAPGTYDLKIAAPHFKTMHYPINSELKLDGPVKIKMGIADANTQITVTAARGNVQDATSTSQVVTVREKDYLARLPLPTIGNALENSPGIMVQQTTYGQSSPHLRGLTGYQTLLLVDGIRFNTSIFRSGPNQYISYVNPSQVERVEAVLGPTSAAYGSDSLGGTINLLTAEPAFISSDDKSNFHGEFNAMGASADASGIADARMSFGTPRVSWLIGGTARRLNNLRTGEGLDSRNSFHRYIGMSTDRLRDLLGSRMKDTGFSQYGVDTKLLLHPSQSHSVTFNYLYGGIRGERSYRDMLGGPGKLQSLYYPQDLNFGYMRYEKQRLGFLDFLNATFSINSQRDGSIKQNQKITDSITTDNSRINAYGYSVQGTTHFKGKNILVFGGESYDERISSTRFMFDPVKATTVQQRAQYPNGTRYMISGLFAQETREIIRGKLRSTLGVRFTDVRMWTYANSNKDTAGLPLGVSNTSQDFNDITFNTGLNWQMTSFAGLNFVAGRGFRAPNASDLSSLGLATLGYDVPSYEAAAAGSFIGTDSGDSATSTGKKLQKLRAESLYSYELGLTLNTSKLYARIQAFDSEMRNPISGRTLLFTTDNIPATIAGMQVFPIAQTADQKKQNVVAVQTSLSPRAVHASVNDGESKYYGIESLIRFKLNSTWHFDWNYAFIAGRDLYPNRAKSKLPPQQGSAAVRFSPSGKYWLELRGRFAGSQYRLSGGDIDDDRVGASRRRSDISTFFKGGYVSSYLLPGPDGKLGTADDLFSPTGETLKQIQDRVLPIGATINGVTIVNDSTRVPLYLGTDGWWTLDVTGGWNLGECTRLNFGLTNIRDKNFRSHGSGVDAAGFNAFAGLRYSF
jgi:hemoglobin/transferrin/lactoferrin receptor protein